MDGVIRKRKRLFIGLAVLVVLCVGWTFLRSDSAHAPTSKQTSAASSTPGVLHVAAMGDMLAHDSIVSQARTDGGYNFKPYFKNIRPLYKNADVVFCNPETLSTGEEFGISGYPTFNAPTEFARDLVAGAGCNLINLATNHMNDKHQAAIDANLKVWENLRPLAVNGVNSSADQQRKISYFTKNGVKCAFLAFADYSNDTTLTPYGLNTYHDTALTRSLLQEARTNADAVIVSAHWGTEDSTTVNDDQKAAAKLFAEEGVDVVIGTGPHVIQETSYVQGNNKHRTLVWYSLGNMLSSQLQVNELTGVIAGFTLTKKQTGGVTVSAPSAHITFMSYDWLAEDKAADRLETRRNLLLQPLSQAGNKPTDMFGAAYTKAERENFVRQTLGLETGVKVTP